METSATARRLARRFVAGETLDDALAVARKLNEEGITVTLDHLGESVANLEEAAAARDVYLRTLEAIHEKGIQGNVSLKLTQFGLDLAYEHALANVDQLVRRAAELDSFVRVDMEASAHTSATLGLVHDLFGRHGHVGVVIQAYLFRSEKDVEELNTSRIRVRLCKGAYLEPPGVAFPDKKDVDRNFIKIAENLLQHGTYPAIASHDEAILRHMKQFVEKHGIDRDSFEFQMLYGIRRDLQRQLVAQGWRLRLYVPFGRAWYPYYMRRLAERPANVLFILRNLFRH